MKSAHKPATHCVHAGQPDDAGPVVTPIYATSTFRFRDADHGAALFAGREPGYIYTRMLNPTVKAFEDCLALLEDGTHGLATASGMAAVSTAIAGFCSAGDHIICSEAVYGPTCSFLTEFMSRFGVNSSIVNTTDLDEVRAAFRPETRLLMVETPGNPTLAISDLAALAGLARKQDALLIVDNTFMSPILQQPLKLGADIVVHSLTKFLNGHADVIGGAIIVRNEEHYRRLRRTLNHYGGVLPPFESYLVHRGIKTLALRMQRHCENAQAVAEFLAVHPEISRVYFPGLPDHPQYELARRQMTGPGGVISFELKGGFEAGRRLMNSTRLCALAVSLGGVESLIQHPASMTHAGMTEEQRRQAGITEGLVRVSVGIEDLDDIRADLEQALAALD